MSPETPCQDREKAKRQEICHGRHGRAPSRRQAQRHDIGADMRVLMRHKPDAEEDDDRHQHLRQFDREGEGRVKEIAADHIAKGDERNDRKGDRGEAGEPKRGPPVRSGKGVEE